MADSVGNALSLLPGSDCGARCIRTTVHRVTRGCNFCRVHAPIFRRARLFRHNINSAASMIRGRVCAFSSGNKHSVALHPRNASNTMETFLRGKLFGRPVPRGVCCLASYCHCRGPRTNELHRFRRFNIRYFNTNTPSRSTRVVTLTGRIFGCLNMSGLSLRVGSVNYGGYHTRCRGTLGRCFTSRVSRLYSAYHNELRGGPVEVLSYGDPVYSRVTGNTPIVASCLYSSYHRRFSSMGGCLSTVGVTCAMGPHVIHKLSCCAHAIFRFISGRVNTRNAMYNKKECSNLVRRINKGPLPTYNFNVNVRELLLLVRTRGAPFPRHGGYSVFVMSVNSRTGVGTTRLTASLHGRKLSTRFSAINENFGTRVGCTGGVNTLCAIILNRGRLSSKGIGLGGVTSNARRRAALGSFASGFRSVIVHRTVTNFSARNVSVGSVLKKGTW